MNQHPEYFPSATRASRVQLAVACLVVQLTSIAGRADGAGQPPVVAGYERFCRATTAPADRVEGGLLLLGALGCVNCHAPAEDATGHVSGKLGPILDGVGGRLAALAVACCTCAIGAEPVKPPPEADFYPIHSLEIPADAVLEVGAVEWIPDGRLAVATRRGEIWMITDPAGKAPAWKRFAHGLHEVLGLAWKDGRLYVTQRPEVGRLCDTTGDGVADVFETVC